MRLSLLTIIFALLNSVAVQAQEYKAMMHDMNVNFYQVCAAADAYFQTHDKGKGSGWKGYQRWKNVSEANYYPSGDRSTVDPLFVTNAYENFLRNAPEQKSLFGSGWRDLGPYNANNITSHYSAGVGRVEDFFVDRNNPNRIYLASRSGGCWVTSDAGATWLNTTDYLVASGVNTVTASHTNADSVLINVQNPNNQTTHGIYRSVDGGLTWTPTPFVPANLGWGGLGTNNRIYRIAYHPTVANLVFIGTNTGIYRSDDDLQTWVQLIPSGDITDITFHPTDPSTVYIYDNDGGASNPDALLISTDFGLSYSNGNSAAGNNGNRMRISVSPDCPNCVYSASGNGVWKSTDQAQNFTFMINPPQSCNGFAVSDTDTSNMVYGYVDLEASNDGGQTFTQRTSWANGSPDTTYIHADMRRAQSINGVFYVATDGYLAKSPDNGISWYRISDGCGIRESYSFGLSQSNWAAHMSGSQDNGTSILLETGWIEWNGGDGMEAIIQPLNDNWMIGSWQYGTRNRTKDRGLSRQGVGTPQTGNWEAPMFYDPNQQMHVYHCGDSLWRSDKFGTGWTYVGTPAFGDIKEGAMAENNSDIIVLARNSDIELSTDGGLNFSSIENGLPNSTITDIAFDPLDDNTIMVCYATYQNNGNKVFITHDLGATWTNVTFNLSDMPIRAIVIDHSDASNIYLGAELGVYTMPMGGTTWTLYNPNLPTVSVRELEIQYGANTIKAATWGRGIWEYTLVGRTDFPAVITTAITDPPTDITPENGFPQDVTSVISYSSTLSSVYVKWSTGSPTFDSTIVMNNTVDSTWVTQTPIPTYPTGTEMYFKVFAVGTTNDTTETYKFHYKVQPSCISNGSLGWQTAVTLVDLDSINRASGKLQPYTDYSGTDSTVVMLTSTYPLTVNVNTDGNYTVYARAWIDWNHDLDFDDLGEEYDLGSAQNTPDGPTDLSPFLITVPSNATLGKAVMRVSAKFGSYASQCETGFDGEVEDYTIVVIPFCFNLQSNIAPTNCYSYTSPSGNTYTTTGLYVDTLQTFSGCDSIINIDLTIYNDQLVNLSETHCNSYASAAGNVYTSTGVYTDTVTASTGCDSVITIDLIINNDDAAVLNEIMCDSFELNGQTYFSTGTYTQSLSTVAGCDSTITLNLTQQLFDMTISQNVDEMSVATLGATYQWFKCGIGNVVGATNQAFTPMSSGDYGVIVSINGCVDTSDCYTMNLIGMPEANGFSNLSIYPNPTTSAFTIDLGEGVENVIVEVHNAIGQLVVNETRTNIQTLSIQLNGAPGVYTVTVRVDERIKVVKVLKE